MEQTVRIVMRFLTFTSLTTFESCESRDNEIVTDILTTPNTLRENSHGCHEIVNTLRDSVVTIVTDRIFTVCFDPNVSRVRQRIPSIKNVHVNVFIFKGLSAIYF